MKHLSVFRHAKAEHLKDYPTDAERPLTPRGQKDAYLVATLLATVVPAIDWIVSSPSRRTRESAEAVTETLNYQRGVVWQDLIYEADAETLLNVLAQVPVEMDHVLILGHNPGMEALISGLAAGSPARLGIKVAAGALAHLTLEIYGWNQIRWGCGTLHSLIRPKQLREK